MKVKIAQEQFQVTGGDIEGNIRRMEALARDALFITNCKNVFQMASNTLSH